MKRLSVLLFFGLLLSWIQIGYADFEPKNEKAFNQRHLSVFIDSAKVKLKFVGEARDSGYAYVTLRLQDGLQTDTPTSYQFSGQVGYLDSFLSYWNIEIPNNGYYFAYVDVAYDSIVEDTTNIKFMRDNSFRIFFAVEDSAIDSYSDKPDSLYYVPPIFVDDSVLTPKTASIRGGKKTTSSAEFTVRLRGRIYSKSPCGDRYGIPGLEVYHDWDDDHNKNTAYNPWFTNGVQVIGRDKAITDANGYYEFNYSITSNDNSKNSIDDFADQFRIIANHTNAATYNHELGNGAINPTTPIASVPSNSTSVDITDLDIEINAWDGDALRYLYRAREFSTVELGFTPGRIRYIVHSQGVTGGAYFSRGSSFGAQILDGFGLTPYVYSINAPHIVFAEGVLSEIAFHEYGHFVDFDAYDNAGKSDFTGDYSESHAWSLETTNKTAYTEGWAEFFAAAAQTYWVRKEDPIVQPMERWEGSTEVYNWPDYSRSYLSTKNDQVEGCFAALLYDLWDDIEPRSTHNTLLQGDNEDLEYDGSLILQANINAHGNGLANASRFITWFLNGLSSRITNSTLLGIHIASIYAAYDDLISDAIKSRPATPTLLNVEGTCYTRTLTWNDNTESSSYGYHTICDQLDDYPGASIYPIRNNENGFRIFRRLGKHNWDGTFTGYTQIGSVGTDIRTYRDKKVLQGWVSYIVVAFDENGNSIPKAQVQMFVDDCSKKLYPGPGQRPACVAVWSDLIETNYGDHFEWSIISKPSYIDFIDQDDPLFQFYNNYKPSNTIYPFVVTCTVKDENYDVLVIDTLEVELGTEECEPEDTMIYLARQLDAPIKKGSTGRVELTGPAIYWDWVLNDPSGFFSLSLTDEKIVKLENDVPDSISVDSIAPVSIYCVFKDSNSTYDTSIVYFPYLSDSVEYIPPVTPTSSVKMKAERTLMTIVPNPARSSTTLQYQLSKPGNVVVAMYDALGREVLPRIEQGRQQAGSYTVPLSTSQLQAGTYICRILNNGVPSSIKCEIVQ